MRKIDPKKLSLSERVEKLNSMILEGKILEAFEKFYAEDITRQHLNNKQLDGKDICRRFEEDFVTGLTERRDARVKKTTVYSKVSVVEWEFDFCHEEWGNLVYNLVIMQHWNCDGLIDKEIIFNNN